jgi:hypothetical protein
MVDAMAGDPTMRRRVVLGFFERPRIRDLPPARPVATADDACRALPCNEGMKRSRRRRRRT